MIKDLIDLQALQDGEVNRRAAIAERSLSGTRGKHPLWSESGSNIASRFSFVWQRATERSKKSVDNFLSRGEFIVLFNTHCKKKICRKKIFADAPALDTKSAAVLRQKRCRIDHAHGSSARKRKFPAA
jgi:hypothetical protein